MAADRQSIKDYILEQQQREDQKSTDSHHDRAGMLVELDSAIEDLDRAIQRIDNLYGHLELGRLDLFSRQEPRIIAAHEAVHAARMNMWCARQEVQVLHPRRTTRFGWHEVAARLAVAHFDRDGRGVTELQADKVIRELWPNDIPSDGSIKRWIQKARSDLSGEREEPEVALRQRS